MTTKLLFFIFIFSNFIHAQKDSVIEKKHYKGGQLKQIAFNRGSDTIELRKYHRNGQIGDSVWMIIDGRDETAIGIEKSYYDNGKLSSITYHGKDKDDYLTNTYRENGMLSSHIIKPTGVSSYYNSKGEIIKQFDENKFDKNVKVSKKYKNQKHLIGTSYVTRIVTKKATLTDKNNTIKINASVLISIALNSDTTILNHCWIEGFSSDSIYLSKFDYNPSYDRTTDLEILKYEKTFALGLNQLKTIIYSEHYNGRRNAAAYTSYVAGTMLELFPILFGILLYKDFLQVAPYYGSSIALGFGLTEYSKYLYKTAVPKKYDMQKWKIKVRS